MKAWFRLSIIEPELKISRVAAITSLLIKVQHDLKKIGDIPLGSGAVRGFICFKALSTSSTVNSLVKSAFIEGVTLGSIP